MLFINFFFGFLFIYIKMFIDDFYNIDKYQNGISEQIGCVYGVIIV